MKCVMAVSLSLRYLVFDVLGAIYGTLPILIVDLCLRYLVSEV